MLSALIPSRRSYPAMQLASQPVNQRSVQLGPLVLKSEPFKFPTPPADRDRTVSRRSEPSSRAILIGEQPNPWDLLQPQDMTSRHRGAKPLRRYELLGAISLLSPEYLLSFERWPFHTETTGSLCPAYRTCSTRRSRSQAPLCHCTLQTITIRLEGTFESLRYSFGGDHPSQTTHQTVSPIQGVRIQIQKGLYFKDDSTLPSDRVSKSPAYPTHFAPRLSVKLQ